MSGSEEIDGAAAMPETMPETMPEAVADEHRASREIGGMAVYEQPDDGSLYGSASDEENGDVDADAAPTRAELLEKIALLEQQAEKLLEISQPCSAKVRRTGLCPVGRCVVGNVLKIEGDGGEDALVDATGAAATVVAPVC